MKPKHKKAQFFSDKGLFAELFSFSELEQRISALPTEQDRGDAFEVFAEAYFKTQTLHQTQDVLPYSGLPESIRNKLSLTSTDKGVDGIFKTHNGECHAYQVKFRTNRQALCWGNLTTFMALSDKADKRVLFTNSNDLSVVMDNRTRFYSIKGNDLDRLDQSDFRAIEEWLKSAPVSREKKIPYPHQLEAIHDILQELNVNDRATAIMACGTGKTLVALWVAEKKDAQTMLILLPSLALIRQTLHDWAKENSWETFNYLCVCSDVTVIKGDDETILYQHDLDFPVTTQKEVVEKFLKNQNISRKIIFSTYQSCQIVAEAMSQGFSFDLAIFDEAHKTASRQGANYAFALQDKNLSIKKRLFLTATPRHYNVNKKNKEDDQCLVYSMDDQATYGREAHKLSFREAVKKNLICDYKVIISVMDSETVNRELVKQGEVVVGGDVIKAQRVANILAVQNAIEKYGVKRIFSFHNSVASAKSFTAPTNEGIGAYLEDFTTLHVNGDMSTSSRETILKEFEESDKAIISNARCLTEGVNVPIVDMVAFVSPKKSKVDIVQAVGRAMRKSDGKALGYILIPLFVQITENESIEQALEKTHFDAIWDVLQAMQEQDENLVEIISQMREELGRTLGYNDNRLRERVEFLGPEICISELRKAITTSIVDRLGLSWDFYFGLLRKYVDIEGHAQVPRGYKVNGSNLDIWVSTQRRAKFLNKLLPERIDKLNSLPGWAWNTIDDKNEKAFKALDIFVAREGHALVPTNHIENNFKLGVWVSRQRLYHSRGELEEELCSKLETYHAWYWDANEGYWESGKKFLLQFYNREKHPMVKNLYMENGFALGKWCQMYRYLCKKNKLSQDKIDFFNELKGWSWDVKEDQWNQGLEYLKKYVTANGNALIPYNYVNTDGFTLGTWVCTQKYAHSKGKLASEKITLLKATGLILDNLIDLRWYQQLGYLKQFRQQHPNRWPQKGESSPPGNKLGAWCITQRTSLKKGTLDPQKKSELAALEFESDLLGASWNRQFNYLKKFRLLYPDRWPTQNEEFPAGNKLGSWCSEQRKKRKKLTQERKEKLNRIGFLFNIKDVINSIKEQTP